MDVFFLILTPARLANGARETKYSIKRSAQYSPCGYTLYTVRQKQSVPD